MNGYSLHLIWCPGHCNIRYNDMADESAKSAAEQLSTEVDIDESTRKMDFETIKKFIREDQMTQSVTFTSIKKGSYLPFYIKKI